jgi:uncharacterized membrane protein YedE/YeeE
MQKQMSVRKAYINPYLAGVLLGFVLLTSFVIAGRGIGASGAVSQALAHAYDSLGVTNAYLQQQKSNESIWQTWIIVEVIGVFFGAWLSAKLGGRFKKEVVRGDSSSNDRRRILFALAGGVLMGFAARLARGCTSGQALTGGALLSVGSWLFMIAVFAGAYLTILAVKRDWS